MEIRNFAYAPPRLEVGAGDTVVWVNRDTAPHTATSSAGRWGSQDIAPGATWRTVVSRIGEQPYVCDLHLNMSGVLVVR